MSKRDIIGGDAIMKDTEFFKWLEVQQHEGNNIDRFVDTVQTYMGDSPQPFKGRNDMDNHKYVFHYFWRVENNKTNTI